MKIMFTVTHSNGEGQRYESGRTYDVPEAQAKDVVARGYGYVVSQAARKAQKRTATRRAPRTGSRQGTAPAKETTPAPTDTETKTPAKASKRSGSK